MIKVSGNFERAMDRWSQLLASADVIVEQASRVQAEVALTLIAEGFEAERDPYGAKWKAKKVDDGRKVLHGETTRLRNGWHVEQSGRNGFTVAPSVEYAAYHQAGTSRMVPRMMVPSASRGLPKEWADEFTAIAIATAIQHFGEAANDSKPHFKTPTISAGGGGTRSAGGNSHQRRKKLRTLRRLNSR